MSLPAWVLALKWRACQTEQAWGGEALKREIEAYKGLERVDFGKVVQQVNDKDRRRPAGLDTEAEG